MHYASVDYSGGDGVISLNVASSSEAYATQGGLDFAANFEVEYSQWGEAPILVFLTVVVLLWKDRGIFYFYTGDAEEGVFLGGQYGTDYIGDPNNFPTY